MLCKICGARRAKRVCPAVDGLICPICCGTEREVSLSCPLSCEYLQEAHKREKPIPVNEREMVYPDVLVTEEFLVQQEELLLFSIFSLVQAALRTGSAVDSDVMSALQATVQTYRTLQSGLLYETRAGNAIAESVQRLFATSLADYRKIREEQDGLKPVRDSEILMVLVFLQRIGQQNQNGRARGRMFIDLLHHMTPDNAPALEAPPQIIV